MLCARCQHHAAVPGGTLCAGCAAAPAAPAGPPFAGAPATWLRSPVGLGRAAAAMLALVAAVDLFAVWAGLVLYDVSGDLVDGEVGEDVIRRADHADLLTAVAGVAQVVALIASCVVFLCWFHRVRANAEVFDPSRHSMKRGWAIGAWFVPVVNLWFPRRITLEIWDASSPTDRPSSHGLVNAWWTLWIIAQVADRVVSRTYSRAETAEELRNAAAQLLFVDVAMIAAAVLAVLVVLRLTRMQHEKALRGPAPAAA
ncbi:DUF4328 domain-containing protein [Streptomyces kebangsaanensis]|uniref:DUF4328 domain-containing protein n=1 Tax=Streptomyces kebangsaanensis TaxID=864058 RepID=A0ABW6KQ01_9ACTN